MGAEIASVLVIHCDLLLKVVSESPASGEEDGTPDLTADSSDDSDSSTKLEKVITLRY